MNSGKKSAKKLTFDDLNWFYEQQGMDIADLSMVPGFENFAACDEIPQKILDDIMCNMKLPEVN